MADDKFMFQSIAQQKNAAGISDADRRASAKWFRDEAGKVSQDAFDPEFHMANALPFQNRPNLSVNSIGKLYSFVYDPKTKDKLPYYDTFPLIFPISFESTCMLGINLHYLSPWHRAKLMNALYTTLNNDKYNSTTKLKISYGILKGASQFELFKPCIKKYLFSHVRSTFMNYNPKVWDYCLSLPMAQFQKKTQEVVWMESLMKVNR